MIEDVVTPTGPYRLRLMCRSGTWDGPLADGSTATAWQRPDGRVVVRAATEAGVAHARFMLALDDDTSGFHRDSSATRCSARPLARSSATGRSGSRRSPTRPCARCAGS